MELLESRHSHAHATATQPIPPSIRTAPGSRLGRSQGNRISGGLNPWLRQPLGANGEPKGPPLPFYSFVGRTTSAHVLNTVSFAGNRMYFLLSTGQSDIWMGALSR